MTKAAEMSQVEERVKSIMNSSCDEAFHGWDDCDSDDILMGALDFARDVLKGRFHEAEPLMLQNEHTAYLYACDVMHDRWAQAEAVFLNSAKNGDISALSTAFQYLMDVVVGQWPEMEPHFLGDPYYQILYPAYIQYLTIINNGEFALFMEPGREGLTKHLAAGQDIYSDLYIRANAINQRNNIKSQV